MADSYRRTIDTSIFRKKPVPKNDDMIQKYRQSGARVSQAFLAKTVVPFNNNRPLDDNGNPIDPQKVNEELINFAKNGVFETSSGRINLNTKRNTTIQSRFDLWVTEVDYGFAATGQKAVSKYYSRHYPKSFHLTPVTVNGICHNEDEYDDLANFIREGQIALSYEPKNVFRLFIPAARIDCLGSIDAFKAGFISNNTGVPVAPTFTFDFVIFKDLRDPRQTIGASATQIINKSGKNSETGQFWSNTYSKYSNDYIVGQLIDDITAKGGDATLASMEKTQSAKQAAAAAKKKAANKSAADDIFKMIEGMW